MFLVVPKIDRSGNNNYDIQNYQKQYSVNKLDPRLSVAVNEKRIDYVLQLFKHY